MQPIGGRGDAGIVAATVSAATALEEGLIALILGVMTVLTFVQVVLRYVFNTGLLWALEANFYLFAWLVLIGISYCVRDAGAYRRRCRGAAVVAADAPARRPVRRGAGAALCRADDLRLGGLHRPAA